MIIKGGRSFTVGWGFSINSKSSGDASAPRILKTTTDFHKKAIKKLKQ